jgi:hypothetical protein
MPLLVTVDGFGDVYVGVEYVGGFVMGPGSGWRPRGTEDREVGSASMRSRVKVED